MMSVHLSHRSGLRSAAIVLGLFILGPIWAPAQEPPELQILNLSGSTTGKEGDGFAWAAVLDGAVGPVLYSWDFGDGTVPVVAFDNAGMNNRYADDGTYTVRLTVESVGGSDQQELEVTVDPAPPKIGLLVAERVGDGDSFHFAAEVRDPGDDELTLSWDFGDGSPPQSGDEGLVESEHSYERDGRYTVTLTATDEDGLKDSRTRTVTIGSSIDVTVTGAVNTRLQTGQGPVYACVVPLGEGGCGIHLQFWDDTNRSYLFLQHYGNPLIEPRTYQMIAADDRQLAEGARVAEATGIVSGGMQAEDYSSFQGLMKVTECDPSKMSGSFMSGLFGGGLRGMGRTLGGLLGGRGGGSRPAPTGGGWAAQSGNLKITAIDHNHIEGTLQSEMAAGKGRSRTTVSVEGSFSAEFEEHVQPFFEMCEQGPFRVSERSPEAGAENVYFGEPDLWVGFTRPVDSDSVSGDSVRLEAKNENGDYRLVPTRKLVDSERQRVHLVPWIELEPARHHRIVVEGGPDGVRSRGGEQLAARDEWQMTTMIDLYRPMVRSNGAVARRPPALPEVRYAVQRGGAPRAVRAVPHAAAPRSLLAKQSIVRDGQTLYPEVRCETFQVSRNGVLVKGKTTAFRIYLDWEKRDVEKIRVDSIFFVGNGGNVQLPYFEWPQSDYFEHPSLWEDSQGNPIKENTKNAKHTANYFGWVADPGVHAITATVVLMDDKQRPVPFDAECPVSHWVAGNPVLIMDFYVLPVSNWKTAPPMEEIKAFVEDSVEYLQQNFPVNRVDWTLTRALEDEDDAGEGERVIVLPSWFETTIPDFDTALNAPKVMMLRLQKALDDEAASRPPWARPLGKPRDVVVGVYPSVDDNIYGPDWNTLEGYNYWSINGGDKDPDFDVRTVRIMYQERTRAATMLTNRRPGTINLAHEVAHTFGLKHQPEREGRDCSSVSRAPVCEIKGFQLQLNGQAGNNKSDEEGNADTELLQPLMYPCDQTIYQSFICNKQYQKLQVELERYWGLR